MWMIATISITNESQTTILQVFKEVQILDSTKKNIVMAKNEEKKRGPKDRTYVNKSEQHEVKHEPKRKKPAKQFGSGSADESDPAQRK